MEGHLVVNERGDINNLMEENRQKDSLLNDEYFACGGPHSICLFIRVGNGRQSAYVIVKAVEGLNTY
jgi:hypothetical protein